MGVNKTTSLSGIGEKMRFFKGFFTPKAYTSERLCENIPVQHSDTGEIPARIPEAGAPGNVIRMVRERSARKRHPLGVVNFGNGNVYAVCPNGWKLRSGETVTLVETFSLNGNVVAAVEKARPDEKG